MNAVNYANVWQRMMANVIDGLIILSIMLLISSLAFVHISFAFIAIIFSHFAYWYYGYYFNGKYGATFGKHFLGLIIVDKDFNRFDFNTSFKRSSVDLGFAVFGAAFALTALFAMDFSNYASLGFHDREAYLASFNPAVSALCAQLFGYWIMSEFAVMMFTKRNQAAQDLFAGTVVIIKEPAKELANSN
ncbi:RDD family protein [Thalassotalea psychrophila]|uniref:RDD family protein n=1 Tax=Thalassotalea psychrophila TaxID=3065647 RepID=A0ABY9TUQ0_9GAMM|nr:RDD family protein [Colwelliaceae bacterium SQ149]